MNIDYRINFPITADRFVELLRNSGLAERRPVDDNNCIEGMVANSSLMISAWDGETLVGVARSMTDFHYACYLSDLAVDKRYQSKGIGKALLGRTQENLGRSANLSCLPRRRQTSITNTSGLSTIRAVGYWNAARQLSSTYFKISALRAQNRRIASLLSKPALEFSTATTFDFGIGSSFSIGARTWA